MNQVNRNIDVVFCIDGSATMGPVMEGVKAMVKKFYPVFMKTFQKNYGNIDAFRAKLIVFRDYGVDAAPMEIGPWFNFIKDEQAFALKLDSIVACGGSGASNGLEAIYLAMKSDFVNGDADRQIIVFVTNSNALEVGARASSPKYPAGITSLGDMLFTWMGLDQNPNIKLRQHGKRLIMVAPEKTKYEELDSVFEGSLFRPMLSSEKLADFDWDDVFRI